MSKERINVTVDPSVKRTLQARDDVNVSGLVNQFLDRYLGGKDETVAAKLTRIERLRDQAEELRREAKSKEQQADILEQELEDQRRERNEQLRRAASNIETGDPLKSTPSDEPIIQTPEGRIEAMADEYGVDPDELVAKAKELHESDSATRGFA